MTAILLHARLKQTRMADGRGQESELGYSENGVYESYPESQVGSSGHVENSTSTPQTFDVLLGRGRWYASHAGNRRLQVFISMYLERYQATKSRPEKTYITNEILHMVKTCGKQPGRFLKFDEEINGWVAVNDEVARLKISQAMRYTIRTPQESGVLPSMQAPNREEARRLDQHVVVQVKSFEDDVTGGGSQQRALMTNPDMGPPAPRPPTSSLVHTATIVQSHYKDADYGDLYERDHDCYDDDDDDGDSDEDSTDNGRLILSDEAILRSLGYSVPKPKKRKSTGDIPASRFPI